MLIYTDQITERLQYTLEYIFTRHGLQYRCTNDKSEFSVHSGSKLNYSEWHCDTAFSFKPSGLLFEETLKRDIRIEKAHWNDSPILSIDGVSDPFAAIFFCLSRYEEYITTKRDDHGRFEAASSVLVKFEWHEKQMVEIWCEAIIRAFCPEKIRQLTGNRKINVIPSFDIDNTFAYKWKSGSRKYLSIWKDRVNKRHERLAERKQVLKGESPDPYDTFGRIAEIAEKYPGTRVFWLLGDYSKFDRNISWRDPRHQRLIRTIAQKAHVGLHPGYASNLSDKALADEKQRLETILHTKPEESRQHFLKLRLPDTYNRLIELGFKRDFTMGFSDLPGFRAGTAHSFLFFDLKRNIQTDYEIVPFVYMDGTFHDYMKISVAESIAVIDRLTAAVSEYGGNFCFIWHNETIGNVAGWKGWSEALNHTLAIFEDGMA